VKTLPKLAGEATDSQLVAAFEKHLAETKGHVQNVEAAFEAIGERPKADKCPGIEGLKTEHDEFVSDESPSPDVLDMFLTGAAARTEHYEIAAYTGLITMAEALGEQKAATLLTENLKQEQAALETVTTISEKLASSVPTST
jgi:ferritin-like metal-binding protein YciE